MPAKIDNKLLCTILSERIDDFTSAQFRPTDWDLLAEIAQVEGVAPLLYWVLTKSQKINTLPKSAQNILRSTYAQSWRQNQKIFIELKTLAQLFNQANIPIVVLKGACFALTIYPDIGIRQMGDLDLLVPKEKLSEAVRIAKTFGYQQTAPEASPGLNDLLSHEVFLQKNDQPPISLEIHHSLVADKSFVYAVPVDWFWDQTEPLIASSSPERFAGLNMLTPTAQILYAAAHAMLQHGGRYTPLRWYYDLDQLLRFYSQRIDWDLLLAQTKKFEWGSALAAALDQTIAYFDTPIPNVVRASLAELTDRHQALVELLKNKPATHVLEERQKLLALNWLGRFRLILALIVPSPAYMRWRYQLKTTWALPIYYLIRWWGIFMDGFYTLVSLVQKRFFS